MSPQREDTAVFPAIIGNLAVRDNAEQRGGYWGQMRAFGGALLSGRPDCPTLWDAYRAMQICEAILDSIEKREPVQLD